MPSQQPIHPPVHLYTCPPIYTPIEDDEEDQVASAFFFPLGSNEASHTQDLRLEWKSGGREEVFNRYQKAMCKNHVRNITIE